MTRFYSLWLNNILIYISGTYYVISLSIYPSVDIGCSHVLAIVNNAAVNIEACVSFWVSIFIFFRQIPRSGIAGLSCCIASRCQVCLTVVLICISLMIYDAEHLCICLLATCTSFLEKCLCSSSAYFLIFFLCWVVWAVYTCRILILYQSYCL